MSTSTAAERRVEDLRVYVAEPAERTAGGMLLLPSASGLSHHLRRCAEEIAGAGTTAVAWDPFHGQDVEGRPFEELMPLLQTITDDAAHAEQARLLAYMHDALGLRTVGTIGWCLGGRLALLLAAREAQVACCVAYHPTIRRPAPPNHTEDAVARARQIRCPVQLVVPGADQVVPREIFAEMRAALEERGSAATDTQMYPGASHGFMERREADEANRIATQLAWPQTLAFIRATLL